MKKLYKGIPNEKEIIFSVMDYMDKHDKDYNVSDFEVVNVTPKEILVSVGNGEIVSITKGVTK
jgi:hypothetical protein